ncbi:putative leucine-rich repeat receptor-like protein kinase [Tanacetum coccineum]|uniref:Leucine-rich repeat receptor-like protein kinase n=1 Tax=Tanacetum coccineum TaxID=301880 RepID=A0ABQ4YEC4_9ASTR
MHVAALREDGCPRVWVVTSDRCQQHAAHGAIKTSQKEVERMLQEHKSTSVQGKLLKHNLDSGVVDALKDLRNKLSETESRD